MTILMYTKTICPYCQMAKQYLIEHQISYTEQVYDDDQQRQMMYDELGLVGDQRTVPQIFVIDAAGRRRRIGGYHDLLYSDVAVGFNQDF